MSDIYHDPIIKKYQQIIEAGMPNVFKGFYQGDPILVPSSRLPALVISKSETQVGPQSSSEDEHGCKLVFTVITDIRKETSDDKTMAPGVSQLYDIIEGREESTYRLKANSLLYILRSNIGLDTAQNLRTDLGNITRVDYGLTIGKRAPDSYAVEGQVEIVAHFIQTRT